MRPSLLAAVIAAALVAAPAAYSAEPYLLGPGVSEYQKFIIYPHLERGFRALDRGDWPAALASFERARSHAPRNAQTALYLADAYRRTGNPGRADRLLAEQRRYTPGDPRLRVAVVVAAPRRAAAVSGCVAGSSCVVGGVAPLAAVPANGVAGDLRLAPVRTRAPLPESTPSPALAVAQRIADTGDTAALAMHLARTTLQPASAGEEARWIGLRILAASQAPELLTAYKPRFRASQAQWVLATLPLALASGDFELVGESLSLVPASSYLDARLSLALHLNDRESARRLAGQIVRSSPDADGALDRVTFRLVDGGASDIAMRLLLDAYPFSGPDRLALTARLALLAADQRGDVTTRDRMRLRAPQADEGSRAMQATLLEAIGECDAVRDVLADRSPAYPAAAWLSLAQCSRVADPGLARYAYTQAAQRAGGDAAYRGLAYQAHQDGDYAEAVRAWSALAPQSMEGAHLLAAATSAVAAGNLDAAGAWLDTYSGLDEDLDDSYWWLRAQVAGSDVVAEGDAISRALSRREDSRYLVRRAQLQRGAGQDAEAVKSLRRAHQLAPDDVTIAAALGYAHLAAGQPVEALPYLVRNQEMHRENPQPSEDLAELHRSLGNFESAQAMARHAIDALGAEGDPERIFRLRRLHEQLGRRWAFSADTTLGDSVAAAGATIPGSAYRSYAQVEAQYRFGQVMHRGDRDALAVYARVFAGSAESESVWPNDRATLGVGVRWKPFRDRVLYVAVEQQFALGSAVEDLDDVLLRVSAAPLNNARSNIDWHPSEAAWWSNALYLDAAHYLERRNSAFTVDYQLGHHSRVAQGQTLEPFVRFQYNGRWTDGSALESDVRAGLGLRWNRWYGGGRHDAYPRRLSAALELQQAVETYLPEKRLFIFTLGSNW